MGLHRGYEPAGSRCTGGPTDGAKALVAHWLGAHADEGGVNSGIYNCRPVRGGTAPSLHGEGRAGDLGVRPYGASYGDAYAQALVDHSAELGIQLVIWERRIWSGSKPDAGWRDYGGVSPHTDHIHAELSREAARSLTVARIEDVLGGAIIVPPSAPTGARPTLRNIGRRDPRTAAWVEAYQRWANPRFGYAQLTVDGWYGSGCERFTREFQRRSGFAERDCDGVVGPQTWALADRHGFRL